MRHGSPGQRWADNRHMSLRQDDPNPTLQRLAPWRTLSRRVVFSGGPVREVAIETVALPTGRVVDDYYQVRFPDYVLIYPEMNDGTVGMLRQYKHGVRRVCLAFPGGGIEGNETPQAAAARELREELGCVASGWESLGSFVTNSNQGCNTAHLFRARECHRVSQPDSGDLEASELVFLDGVSLREPVRLEEIGVTSHVALLLLATARGR
jgi:ADP-ribose pyrophosphatase